MLICKDGCGAENLDTASQCAYCRRSLNAALRVHNPGTLVRHYRIKRVIGWGGFGAVYETEDTRQPGRIVALKESIDPSGMSSFQGEFNALQQHPHAHLPRYEAMFVEHGNGYLVMEFIPGQNLIR
jgi:eukaryotic-like serine/threonine-protein kinase